MKGPQRIGVFSVCPGSTVPLKHKVCSPVNTPILRDQSLKYLGRHISEGDGYELSSSAPMDCPAPSQFNDKYREE